MTGVGESVAWPAGWSRASGRPGGGGAHTVPPSRSASAGMPSHPARTMREPMAAPTIVHRRRPGLRQAFAAIAASCVVHAGVLALPYLGTGAAAVPAFHAAGGPPQAALRVTLGGERAASESGQPDAGASSATSAEAAAAPVDTPAAVDAAAAPTQDDAPSGAAEAAAQSSAAAPRTEGAGLLPIDGVTYYASGELTRRPQPLGELALDPPELQPYVASGKMVIALWIDSSGGVENAVVEQSDLPGPFAKPAAEAFRRVHFAPGELDGRKVATVMRIEVTYEDLRLPRAPI